MEQNILKRYNEIHIMLWEEVIKVFAVRTREIRDIEYYRVNQEQMRTLYIQPLKRSAIFNLFVRGKITEQEKNNLLMNSNCSVCYISNEEHNIQVKLGKANMFECICFYCPIEKWRKGVPCKDYYYVEERINGLRKYIMKCITGKKEFNLVTYMKLRKDIMKKMYIVAHLEWGYEQNEV